MASHHPAGERDRHRPEEAGGRPEPDLHLGLGLRRHVTKVLV